MNRDSIINWALLFGLGIIWGFSFFFIKRGLLAFDAYQVGALRIFLAFISLLPVIAFLGLKIPKKKIPLVILSSLLGSGIPPFLFSIAQTKISSSVTGILNSLTPLFALLAGVIVFNLRMKWNHLLGVLVGLVGTVVVVLLRSDGHFDFNFGYSLLVVLATALYGFNANIIKSKLHDVHPIHIALGTFCFLGPIAGIYIFTTDFVEVLQTNEKGWSSLMYLGILAIVGTSYALIVFNYLAMRTSALFATMVTYIIPVVAMIIGVFDGESLGAVHIIGLGLILVGVYISSLGRKMKRKTGSKQSRG